MNNEDSAPNTPPLAAPAAVAIADAETPDNYTCPICYDPINVASGEVRLSCSHRFHLSCVGTWISRGNTNCPYCRGDLAETEQFAAVPDQEQVLLPEVWHFPPLQQQMEIIPNLLIDNNHMLNAHDNLINDIMNNLINQAEPIIGNQNVANDLIYHNNLNYNLNYNLNNNNLINQTVLFPQFHHGLLAAPVQQQMHGLQG